MAELFIDGGGDHYDETSAARKWDVFQDVIVEVGTGFEGSNCLTRPVPAYTRVSLVKRVSTAPANVVLFGFKFRAGVGVFPLSSFYTAYVLAAVHAGTSGYSDATKHVSLNVLADGRLEARRGSWSGTVLGATVDPVFGNSDAWVNVGVRVTISPTVGTFEVMRAGVPVLSLTGLNTQPFGTSAIGAVEYIPWALEDFWINDLSGSDPLKTTYQPGGFHVRVARPVANDAVQWVPAAGANFENVDDAVPDAEATHVRTQFAGDVDLYQLETLDPASLLTVQVNAFTRKASSSVASTFVAVVEIDGVRYESAPFTLTTTSLDLLKIWSRAPDDGAQWTSTKVNAARWGFKRVS